MPHRTQGDTVHLFIKVNTDEQLDEELPRVKSGGFLHAGASVSVELGSITLSSMDVLDNLGDL